MICDLLIVWCFEFWGGTCIGAWFLFVWLGLMFWRRFGLCELLLLRVCFCGFAVETTFAYCFFVGGFVWFWFVCLRFWILLCVLGFGCLRFVFGLGFVGVLRIAAAALFVYFVGRLLCWFYL